MKAAVNVRFSPSRLCVLGNSTATKLIATPATRRSFTSSGNNLATWGFIGLGRMGFPMAKNLRAKIPTSDKLIICDRNTQATDNFLHEAAASSAGGGGIEVVKTPRQVAEQSETIITVLPEPSHVKNVFHNILEPALPQISPERLFIDCSTIDPTSSREVANAVHATAQGRFVDAPMSGGVVGARDGTLTFMLGASSRSGQLVERVKPILLLMGARTLHLGEQGAGLSAKLANNYLLAISNIATCEAMNLGIKWGLDPKALAELINTSSGQCWSSTVNNPVASISPGAPAENEYEGGFAVELMKKDMKLAMEAAAKVGALSELGEKAVEVYEHVEAQEPGKDFSVVYRWLGGKV